MEPPPVPSHAYRLFTPAEWAAVQSAGAFTGTALDTRDGFIHLSLPTEVKHTCGHYFKGQALVLARVSLEGLRTRNDYVESRRAFFPHVLDLFIPVSAFGAPVTLTWDEAVAAHTGFPEGF